MKMLLALCAAAAALLLAGAARAAQRDLALQPLVGEAAARAIDGELRCSFSTTGHTPLLLAAADVGSAGRPTAAVRFRHAPVRLVSPATGGFDALARGAAFRGSGVTATVTRGTRIATDSEETRHTARLRVARAGSSRLYRGVWTCGP